MFRMFLHQIVNGLCQTELDGFKALIERIGDDCTEMNAIQHQHMDDLLCSTVLHIKRSRTQQEMEQLDELNKAIAKDFCSSCHGDCCKIEGTDEFCFYLKDDKCTIYEIRPLQCKRFSCGRVGKEFLKKYIPDMHIIDLGGQSEE